MIVKRLHFVSLFLSILSTTLLMTGCGDLVEIQDRDFVLALGIAYHHGQYQVTYSLPDLGAVTAQSAAPDENSLLRTYEGASLPEIEQSYNFNSESRLDYRHLQVIILDASVCSDQTAMSNLLIQIDDNYNISHNALVYFYDSPVKGLMEIKGVNGSIGEHLKKLNKNNHTSGIESAKIGSLIDCIYNERTLLIPALQERDNSIAIGGGIFFRENQMLRPVSQPESEIYHITQGQNNEYLIRLSPEHLVQLKEVRMKTNYEGTTAKPVVNLRISGTFEALPGAFKTDEHLEAAINDYIQQQIEEELDEFMKRNRIDYLNLYERSSYQNRAIWLHYKDRLDDFIEDVEVQVSVSLRRE